MDINIESRLMERMRFPNIAGACRQLVVKYFPELQKLRSPVNLPALAKKLGIQIEKKELTQYDGSLSWDDNGRATIAVSTIGGIRRQRFTIAHELGHWLLQKELLGRKTHPLFRGLSSTKETLTQEERIVNRIAAEILVPHRPLTEWLAQDGLSLKVLTGISRTYQVSRQMAIRRLAEVSEMPIVYLNVVPYRFNESDSLVEIDEALYATSHSGVFFDRDFTRLIDRPKFSELVPGGHASLDFCGSKGKFSACFDIGASSEPIPNADLFAIELRGLNEQGERFLQARS